MFATYTTSAAASLAGAYLVVSAFLPDQQFLTVHEMTVDNGQVYATRTINADYVVADWRVTIVAAKRDAPSCATVPGVEVHQGWSPYKKSAKSERTFSVDDWVGDRGCYERLQPGEHKMYVTWTPRDDSQPVTAKTTFTKD